MDRDVNILQILGALAAYLRVTQYADKPAE